MENLVRKVESFMTQGTAHDFLHVMRVYESGQKIGIKEGADMNILEPALLLHDLGMAVPGSKETHAERSVIYANQFLEEIKYLKKYHEAILYAIKYHSWRFSNLAVTLEHKILQDADKLDGLGSIGVIRAFLVGAQHGRLAYDRNDPEPINRELDDNTYTLDHFYTKLFKLPDLLHTATAREIAKQRVEFMYLFINQLVQEI